MQTLLSGVYCIVGCICVLSGVYTRHWTPPKRVFHPTMLCIYIYTDILVYIITRHGADFKYIYIYIYIYIQLKHHFKVTTIKLLSYLFAISYQLERRILCQQPGNCIRLHVDWQADNKIWNKLCI